MPSDVYSACYMHLCTFDHRVSVHVCVCVVCVYVCVCVCVLLADMVDYYATLGVDRTATTRQIKRAYRNRTLQCHPDKPGGSNAAFIELKTAYEVLIDDMQRAAYDASIEDNQAGPAAAPAPAAPAPAANVARDKGRKRYKPPRSVIPRPAKEPDTRVVVYWEDVANERVSYTLSKSGFKINFEDIMDLNLGNGCYHCHLCGYTINHDLDSIRGHYKRKHNETHRFTCKPKYDALYIRLISDN